MSSTTDGSNATDGKPPCSHSYSATSLQSSQEAEATAAEVLSRNQSLPWICLQWTCFTSAPQSADECERIRRRLWEGSWNFEEPYD